uniref:DNA-directed RNA polymerase subunit n=1 Tax=Borodinellopsis insignis TaxID=3229915 RepID=A0AB39U435_9CHLO
MNANTLHHKTFKPQKGGLFCERIFGPLKDFECACGKIQKPNKNILLENKESDMKLRGEFRWGELRSLANLHNSEKKPLGSLSTATLMANGITPNTVCLNINNSSDFKGTSNSLIKKYCPTCDVEYTWSVVRRYQLGYIQLASPVTHVWYLKGTPSYISILLDIKKRHLEYVTYCSETLTLEHSYKGDLGFSLNNPSQIFSAWEKLMSANSRNNVFVNNVEFNGSVKKHKGINESILDGIFSKNLHNFRNPINNTSIISNRLDFNNLKNQNSLERGTTLLMPPLYYPFYKNKFYKKNLKKTPILLFHHINKQNSKNIKNLLLPKKRNLWRKNYSEDYFALKFFAKKKFTNIQVMEETRQKELNSSNFSSNLSISHNKHNKKWQSPYYLPIILNNLFTQNHGDKMFGAKNFRVSNVCKKFGILWLHNYEILNLILYNQFSQEISTLKLPKKLEKLVKPRKFLWSPKDIRIFAESSGLRTTFINNFLLTEKSPKKIWKKMPICLYINILDFLKTNLIWETYGVNTLIMDFLEERTKDQSVIPTSNNNNNNNNNNISSANQMIALEYIKSLYNSDFGAKKFTVFSPQNHYRKLEFNYSTNLIKKIPLIISSDFNSSEVVKNSIKSMEKFFPKKFFVENFLVNNFKASLFINNTNKHGANPNTIFGGPIRFKGPPYNSIAPPIKGIAPKKFYPHVMYHAVPAINFSGVITPHSNIYLGILTNTIEKAWKKIYKSAYQRAIYEANKIVYKIAPKNLLDLALNHNPNTISGAKNFRVDVVSYNDIDVLLEDKMLWENLKLFFKNSSKHVVSNINHPKNLWKNHKKPLIFYLMLKNNLLSPKKYLKKFLLYQIKSIEFHKDKRLKKAPSPLFKKFSGASSRLKRSTNSIASLILKSSQYANVQKFSNISDICHKYICENLCKEFFYKYFYKKKFNTNKIVKLLYKQLLKPLLVLKIFSLYKDFYKEFSNAANLNNYHVVPEHNSYLSPENQIKKYHNHNIERLGTPNKNFWNYKNTNKIEFYWQILYEIPNFISLYKGFWFNWPLRIKKIIWRESHKLLSGDKLSTIKILVSTTTQSPHKRFRSAALKFLGPVDSIGTPDFLDPIRFLGHFREVRKPNYIINLGTLFLTHNYYLPKKLIWVDNRGLINWKKEFIYNIENINKNKQKQFHYKRLGNLLYISNNSRKIVTKKEKKIHNNIYSLSHRERWQIEKDWQFFILFMSAPSEFIDQTIPAYINRFSKKEHNRISLPKPNEALNHSGQVLSKGSYKIPINFLGPQNIVLGPPASGTIKSYGQTLYNEKNNVLGETPCNININAFYSGPGIIQQLLNELDFYSLKKMDKQNRILLYQINKQIFSIKKKLKYKYTKKEYLNKYKKRDQLIRRTKLVRKLFRTESNFRDRKFSVNNVLGGTWQTTSWQTGGELRLRSSSKILRQKSTHNSPIYRVEGSSTPNSMILTTVPVLPPDLRPIVQIGSQIAASDLNRLYQRVIYRNDRLKKFLKDPATTHSYEMKYAQRLLQEAVDNLIQNGKSGVVAEKDSRGRALKSLSDLLKGKQGRFRQYLLGKRVDYSGRSVIVVGPKLKLHECGIPKEMALELYLPFLLKRILNQNLARTVIGAKTLLKTDHDYTWELLREIMQVCPVLLNRAPTLHRLGIQAFQPKLVDGRAILLHPLVCPAFNADFDGDQMAVHVPITVEARSEAWKLMLSRNNLLAPATGEPLAIPSQDMVLGCYYLTTNCNKGTLKYQKGFGYYFQNFSEVIKAYDQHKIDLHAIIWVKWNGLIENGNDQEEPIEIRLTPHGNWQEINQQSQKSYCGEKNFLLNNFVSTTPGKILFNLIIKNCV